MKLLTLPVVFAAVLMVATLATAQVRMENPQCYSTTEDYIVEEITVPIQPQAPVTIKRFQGPQLKLYCISFDEAGPTCGTTAKGTAQLCSRPVSSSSAAYSCEDLTMFSTDPNGRITRGSVHGQEMIWLLRWDGTQQALNCFPKVVTARMLIFVQDSQVYSLAVLIIMLILVAIAVALMAIAFYSFLAGRFQVIDGAGATTIGGPGVTYRGPQMQVAGGQSVVNHTRVLLPVRPGDTAANDMRGSRFGQLTTLDENVTTEEILMPSGKRTNRPSPPRPGDGVRDGMFPSPNSRRNRGGEFGDYDDGEEFYDDESGYTRGRGRGRGRRGRGGRNGSNYSPSGRGRSNGEPSEGAAFPTQSNVETAGGAGFAGYDEDGAPLPQGFGGPVKQVKYIPRWMQGSFGRGGMVPEPLDGTFPEDNEMTGAKANNRTNRDMQEVATMGVYSRMSPKRKTPERTARDGDFGGGSENRLGAGSSGLKHRKRGGGALSDRSPNDSRRLGYNSENEQQDSFRPNGGRGNRRHNNRGPRQNLRGQLQENDENEEVDNFQRGKARLSSGQNIDPSASHRSNRGGNFNGSDGSGLGPRGGLDSSAPLPSRMNTTSMDRPGAQAYKCQSCGYQLTGTSQDPPYCSVSGDRHY